MRFSPISICLHWLHTLKRIALSTVTQEVTGPLALATQHLSRSAAALMDGFVTPDPKRGRRRLNTEGHGSTLRGAEREVSGLPCEPNSSFRAIMKEGPRGMQGLVPFFFQRAVQRLIIRRRRRSSRPYFDSVRARPRFQTHRVHGNDSVGVPCRGPPSCRYNASARAVAWACRCIAGSERSGGRKGFCLAPEFREELAVAFDDEARQAAFEVGFGFPGEFVPLQTQIRRRRRRRGVGDGRVLDVLHPGLRDRFVRQPARP